jgi:hypothetical protein
LAVLFAVWFEWRLMVATRREDLGKAMKVRHLLQTILQSRELEETEVGM